MDGEDRSLAQLLTNFAGPNKVTRARTGQKGQEGQECKKCDIIGLETSIIPLSFSLIFRNFYYQITCFSSPFLNVPNIQKMDGLTLTS